MTRCSALRWLRPALLALLLGAAGTACAQAAPGAAAASGEPDEQPSRTPPGLPETPLQLEPDLYLEAMQAISEGRKNDASSTLARMAAKGPRHAGEWLDLAMLQCALGHADEAEQLFQAIETRYAPPPGILKIITEQRAQGCASWRRQHQWALNLGRGYDRNVNQGASNAYYVIGDGSGGPQQLDPDYLPKADHYSLLSADYITDLSENGDVGFVQLHTRRNDVHTGYDTASVFAGVDHPWRWQRWQFRASGLAGMLSLGGQLYQTQSQVQLRVTPPLPLPKNTELSIMSGMSHVKYRSLTNFDSNTLELKAQLAYRGQGSAAYASVGRLNDHAIADRPGGNRSGWSASLSGRSMLPYRLEGELEWTGTQWQGQTAYSPGVVDQVRRQNSSTTRATLSYPLTATTALQLEWRKINNNENISIFQYDNQVLQLSWRWRDGR
ncbi:tetratricopeptide repeat protein [Pseudoduganella sp. UC29_71]|uniref:tetratricopeptide repeat protein n=1 Tax=Pseudoduganella sp. UC29_71 TaxID=3350174 RepID=UPI00366EB0D9